MWEQGTTALRLFLEVSNDYFTDSHPLHCFLEQAQLELGIATPFFQVDYIWYGFLLTDCWVKFLWSFLAYTNFSLHTETLLDLGLQQVNDQLLMDTFSALGSSLIVTCYPSTAVALLSKPSQSQIFE